MSYYAVGMVGYRKDTRRDGRELHSGGQETLRNAMAMHGYDAIRNGKAGQWIATA